MCNNVPLCRKNALYARRDRKHRESGERERKLGEGEGRDGSSEE